jgi:hypothetical protein
MLQNQRLYLPAAVFPSEKPGRDNPRVIHNKEITRSQQAGEVIKMVVGEFRFLPINEKKSGTVPG